jgi:serine/threonine-protein kinase RsbW
MQEGYPYRKEWSMPSIIGCERTVIEDIAAEILRFEPGEERIEDIKTALAEACLNAIEHGNRSEPGIPVKVAMVAQADKYLFTVTDRGTSTPALPSVEPRLIDKWREEKPRGWGLYLMRSLADRLEFGRCEGLSFVEIQFTRKGETR